MTFRPLLSILAFSLLVVSPTLASPAHRHVRHHHARPAAKATAAKSVTVWVNTNSGVYHYSGERWYGNTKEGKYMSEATARAEGDRATENGQ